MSNEKLYKNLNLCSAITFAAIVRWSVSLYPYSGQNKPPMYGDYEAQRHWMEITLNLPLEEWYFNTSRNDLLYWGLDYPPLTAYHSYINGKVGHLINPEFVRLETSRGYESYDHKFFMRLTVIFADLIVYFIPVILFFNAIYKKNINVVDIFRGEIEERSKLKTAGVSTITMPVSHLGVIAITLLYPGLILIDHGHFQYNSVSLGFTVLAVTNLLYDKLLFSAFYYCLALNYKQMSLYHSLPFFTYMLSKCLHIKKPYYFRFRIQRLIFLSMTVLITFGMIWFPFLSKKEIFLQVMVRLFPLGRGIFEDKVSNFWCILNVAYKLNHINKILVAKICTAFVLLTSFSSLYNLFISPSFLRFTLSMINVSLSFFLFSYQVHEKSILLVALPVLLFFPFAPFPCFWFLLISTFSMFPLFLKDELFIPFASLSLLFALFVFANVNFSSRTGKNYIKNYTVIFSKKNFINLTPTLFKLSLLGCFILTLCSVLISPPSKYPDIWPLLISAYSFLHFILFLVYFNFIQIKKSWSDIEEKIFKL